MLSKFGQFVKQQESDIVLLVGIVLLCLISFGAGIILSSPQNGEIIIENPANALVSVLPKTDNPATDVPGVFVASRNSNKYHQPDCPSAKKIAPENQIWFSSATEAQSAGYTACGICKPTDASR